MQMFQSVSGHSSEQSIVNCSSRSTISQLLGFSTLNQTDLRITNHRGHKFPPSLALLVVKIWIEWPPVLTATAPSFPAVFLNSGSSQGNLQGFRLKGLLWWQKLTWRSSIFFKICRFHSWILRSLFSLHDWSDACFKLKVAWFSWIDHSSFVM